MALAAFRPGGAAFPTIGGGATDFDPAYGGKPMVPSPGAAASTAIGSNIANLSSLYSLGRGVSDYGQTQILANLEKAIPNYSELVAQSSRNIGSELAGQVPGDVVTQLLQRAAERGIMTGSPGGPNTSAAYLRALGLTSLDLTGMGERNLTGAVGRTPLAQPFDISRMLITPEEQQSAEMAASLYASAPVPSAAAAAARAAAASGLPRGGFGGGGLAGVAPSFGGVDQVAQWWNDPNSPWNTGYTEPMVGSPGYTGEYGGVLQPGEVPPETPVDYAGAGMTDFQSGGFYAGAGGPEVGTDYYE